jgi:hypothetical protein
MIFVVNQFLVGKNAGNHFFHCYKCMVLVVRGRFIVEVVDYFCCKLNYNKKMYFQLILYYLLLQNVAAFLL